MNKTPVSILQEMMVKKQLVPNYELIHDGGGTHINTFVYQVSCDGLTATGMGRCKKDAKHEAAKAMLEAIANFRNYPQLPATPGDSPIRTPSPAVSLPVSNNSRNMPFLNAVGELQALCCENDLGEPEYHLISDVGPPHARIFTYQCVVATFKEEGVATTKKQAKQEASKKMLNKIQDLIADLKDTNLKDINKSIMAQELIANELAKARYPTLSRLNTTKKNLGLKLSRYHVALKNHFDEEARTDLINKLSSLVPEKTECSSLEETAKLAASLEECIVPYNLELTMDHLDSTGNCHVAVAKVNCCPDIVEIMVGDTKEEVELHTLVKLIRTMLFLLQ